MSLFLVHLTTRDIITDLYVIVGRAITCLDGIHETPLAAFTKSTGMRFATLRNKWNDLHVMELCLVAVC